MAREGETKVWKAAFFLAGLIAGALTYASEPLKAEPASAKRKVVKYRKHTELDFSGQAVEGKIRAPEIFYIFQRKRSAGHFIAAPPATLSHLREPTARAIAGALGGGAPNSQSHPTTPAAEAAP